MFASWSRLPCLRAFPLFAARCSTCPYCSTASPPAHATSSAELRLKPKAVRAIASSLTDRLKKATVSRSKGGLRERPRYLPSGSRELPPPDVPAAAAAAALDGAGLPLARPAAARRLIEKLPERSEGDAALARLAPRFDAKEALAFAVTQAPARFACLERVLQELRFRYPDFRPAAVLDYASGPGAGIWAATEVRARRRTPRAGRGWRPGAAGACEAA
jgi:Mitochondrial small ribosomal subunit Rsm22